MISEPEKDELSAEDAERLCREYEQYWEKLRHGATVAQGETEEGADLRVLAALHGARQAVQEDSVADASTCDWMPAETGGPASARTPRLPPGTHLGDYLIKELLGRGGMGEVYLAEHELMGRQVAIKVLPTDRGGSASSLGRFHREIRTLARLGTHPNLAAAFDAGVHDGCIFLVLEYIPGTDLKDLVLRQGPLEPAKASDYIRQAALGLEHAHEHGIVHRDIKPANLMLTPEGTIKVLDLGLAQAREATGVDEGHTQAGMLLGTPDYLSPEQAEDPRQADARSDLYSLGCTWYFLLTGRPPFAGESALSKLRAHALTPPPSIRQLRPEVPEITAAIVDRLLNKRPEDRFASARELVAAVDSIRARSVSEGNDNRQPASPIPGESSQASASPPRRRSIRRWLPAATASALLVGGGLAFLLFNRDQSPKNAFKAPAGFVERDPKVKEAAKASPKIAPPPVKPAAEKPVLSWEIKHWRLDDKSEMLTELGRIGRSLSKPLQGDRVEIVAQCSEPAYWYLLAINPDGSLQILFPDPTQKEAMKPARDFRAPLDSTKYYTLDDAGLQGLVLLAAREQLPDFEQWRPKLDPEAWKKVKTTAVWTFRDNDLRPMNLQRIGITEDGPTVLAGVCRRLEARREHVTVGAVAFAVRAK